MKFREFTESKQLNEFGPAAAVAKAAAPIAGSALLAGALELLAVGLGYVGRRALISNIAKHGKVLKTLVNLYNYLSEPSTNDNTYNKYNDPEFLSQLLQPLKGAFTSNKTDAVDLKKIQDYLNGINNTGAKKLTSTQQNAISAWDMISKFAPDNPDAPVIDPPKVDPNPPAPPPAEPYPDDKPIIPSEKPPPGWPEGIPWNPKAPEGPQPPRPGPAKPETPPKVDPDPPAIPKLPPRVIPSEEPPPPFEDPEADPKKDPEADPKKDPEADPKDDPVTTPLPVGDPKDDPEDDPDPVDDPAPATLPLPFPTVTGTNGTPPGTPPKGTTRLNPPKGFKLPKFGFGKTSLERLPPRLVNLYDPLQLKRNVT